MRSPNAAANGMAAIAYAACVASQKNTAHGRKSHAERIAMQIAANTLPLTIHGVRRPNRQ